MSRFPQRWTLWGYNNNLAGVTTGAGEIAEARSGGTRSDQSKTKRPLRGAPPSSLSQPVSTDHSRSSSPSKTNKTPSLPVSRSTSPSKIPSTPFSSRPSSVPFNKSANTSKRNPENFSLGITTQRGRPVVKGRAVTFKHHPFLPHNITAASPPISSFQPQFPTSETQPPSSSYSTSRRR